MPIINYNRNVMTFESPAELAAYWQAHPEFHNNPGEANAQHWYGGTAKQQIRAATLGDESGFAQAQALIDRLSLDYATPAIEMVPSVFGGVPIVGEYLGGEPECMRTLVTADNANAPMRIFADNGSSAAVSHTDLVTRGVSILALILQLSRVRPVEFFVCDHGNAKAARELSPFGRKVEAAAVVTRCDLIGGNRATAIFACVNPGYTRRFAYDVERHFGNSSDGMTAGRGWAKFGTAFSANGYGGNRPPAPEYDAGAKWQLDLQPDDLFIPGAHVDDPCIRDPTNWLQATLARLTASREN